MTPITLQLIKKPAIYGMILLISGSPLVCGLSLSGLRQPREQTRRTIGDPSDVVSTENKERLTFPASLAQWRACLLPSPELAADATKQLSPLL